MDAETLFQQGVIAIRDQGDLRRGHTLLTQSLQQNPHNDMAWLWLTRTVRSPQTRLEYLERALRINPANVQAQQLKDQLQAPQTVIVPLQPRAMDVVVVKTVAVPVTQAEKTGINQLMQRADDYLAAGDPEAAVRQWIEVLSIRVDHEEALAKAASHLWRMHYQDDARELIGRAVLAGTTIRTIYMTAIDMADRQGDYAEAEALRDRIASLPDADEQLLVTVVDYYSKRVQPEQAMRFIERALQTNPNSQKLLLRMGDLLEELDQPQAALAYYDRAVRVSARTPEGRAADRRLSRAVPSITDRERGSVGLALRETAGFAIFLLVMAWQDAGLNLLDMGLRHWAGVILGFIGGYLLITATSSPQQDPIASWLDGVVPEKISSAPRPGQAKQEPTALPILPEDARYVLGFVGVVVLILAGWLVFHRSIEIIIKYPPPYLPW